MLIFLLSESCYAVKIMTDIYQSSYSYFACGLVNYGLNLLRFNNATCVDKDSYLNLDSHSGRLKVAWWNTSISPYGGTSPLGDFENVISVIVELSKQNDILVLGEFEDENIARVLKRKLPQYMKFVSLYHKSGRLVMKNALIYDLSKMSINEHDIKNIVKMDSAVANTQYRVAQRVRLEMKQFDALIDLFVVHWNQKDEPYGDDRKIGAICRLNREMFGEDEVRLCEAATIVVGDFNSEPSSPIFRHMNVTRSIDYSRNKGSLYNPFWRKLHDGIGTLVSDNTVDIRSHRVVFDSIILSHKFLLLPRFKCKERIYGQRIYKPGVSEHSPIGVEFWWHK